MKIYIAGKIDGDSLYKEKFNAAVILLQARGHNVLNPAILPDGFDYEDYMHICFAMIDVCDCIYLLEDWIESPGAKREKIYAENKGKPRFREHPGIDC